MANVQDFLREGDIVLDATGKPFSLGAGDLFPAEVLLFAYPADTRNHRWMMGFPPGWLDGHFHYPDERIRVDQLTLPLVVVSRHGEPVEIFVDENTTAGLSAAVPDQPVAPGDAPTPVEQG